MRAIAPRGRTPDLLTAASVAALALLGWQAMRLARALAEDVAAYRRSAARLRREWRPVRVPGVGVVRMHARVAEHASSRAPAVVLVHGYGVGSRYFVPLAARLADTVSVLAPDLPGHGASDRPGAPLSVPELAGALAAWMRTCGLRDAVLVGQSMGAQIATELAAREPALVSGLVLVGPTLDPTARAASRQVARAAISAPAERPLLDVWAGLDYLRVGPRWIAAEMRHMLAHRIEELLPVVGVPSRVVRGAQDRISPQAWAEAVASRLGSSAPVVTIAGQGHAVQYGAPEAVAAVVRALVAEVRDGARPRALGRDVVRRDAVRRNAVRRDALGAEARATTPS